MWRAAALLFGAVLSISCAEEEQDSQRDWFPLRVGTRWIYDTMADSVIAEHTINGNTYYELAGSLLSRNILVRTNDQGQLVALVDGSELVLFDFMAPVGTAWDIPGYTVTVANRNLPNVVVPAGTFSGCFVFYYQGPIDGSWEFVVAPEVGVVFKSGGFGFVYQLVRMDP